MFDISYSFDGQVKYQSYNQIVSKILEFKNWEHLGMDGSGKYGIFGIVVGDSSKPAIFINGAVHGNEYHVIEPIIHTLKLIEDGKHPDKELNDEILENYCIVAIPMCNPYGMMEKTNTDDRGIYGYRYTHNGGDINRQFGEMLLKEQRIMRDFFNRFKPFSSGDFHMFNPPWSGASPDKYVAIGNTNPITNDYLPEWVETLENATGIPTEVYKTQPQPGSTGSIRGFFATRKNPYTPHTLGFMFEHERRGILDGEVVERITSIELWNVVSLNVTLMLKYSIKYFEEYNDYDGLPEYDGDLITEVRTPQKNVKVIRNYLGFATEIIEEFESMRINTTILRDSQNRVGKIVRKKTKL